jgi:hypothetical protein
VGTLGYEQTHGMALQLLFSDPTEGFELPQPPQGLIYPEAAQGVATALAGSVLAVVVLYALWDWHRTRSPLMLGFLAGGAVCYLNEPIDDLLGLVWYPRPGQWVAFTTFSPVPWWGLFVYILFFGAVPYLALRSMQRHGVTVRSTWTWFAAFFILDALIEQPIIHSGLYHYYGNPPFELLGFPLYWMFINAGGPMLEATLILAAPRFFHGPKALLVVALGMVTDIACSTSVGWPVFSALNAQAAEPIKWGAALSTMALGVLLIQAIAALGIRANTSQQDVPIAVSAAPGR